MGTIDAYDTSNNTYRIRFDRESLGTLSVPDEDVVSAGELDTLPLSTFTVPKARPARPVEPDSPKLGISTMLSSFSPQVQANDPLLSGRSPRGKVIFISRGLNDLVSCCGSVLWDMTLLLAYCRVCINQHLRYDTIFDDKGIMQPPPKEGAFIL